MLGYNDFMKKFE